MPINSIDLPKLRNAEFIQFSKDALGIVQLNNPSALNVTPWYTAFNTATSAIEELFKTDRSNPITEELQTIDQRRDDAITGITAVVQGYTSHFAPTTSTAAKTLANHLSVFGSGIARENYQSETAIINSIITDWNTQPELMAAIAALGLGSWITELDTANKTFGTQYLARTQQLGAVSPDTIKAKRTEAAAAWYKLRDKIDAYYEINDGAQPFAKTVNELNALLDQYNNLIASRKGNSATTTELPK